MNPARGRTRSVSRASPVGLWNERASRTHFPIPPARRSFRCRFPGFGTTLTPCAVPPDGRSPPPRALGCSRHTAASDQRALDRPRRHVAGRFRGSASRAFARQSAHFAFACRCTLANAAIREALHSPIERECTPENHCRKWWTKLCKTGVECDNNRDEDDVTRSDRAARRPVASVGGANPPAADHGVTVVANHRLPRSDRELRLVETNFDGSECHGQPLVARVWCC